MTEKKNSLSILMDEQKSAADKVAVVGLSIVVNNINCRYDALTGITAK